VERKAAAAGAVSGRSSPASLRFCCWNVNGLTTERKAEAVAEEMLRGGQYDVVGLTETHLSQAGEMVHGPLPLPLHMTCFRLHA